MTLQEKIKADLKEAMLARNEMETTVLRNVIATFMTELMAKKGGVKELSEDDAVAVVKRLAKQRKDSIEQFTKGGRKDLVKIEEKELKILEVYLPQMMSRADIKKFAEKKIAEMGADKSKSGMIVGAVMKELKGKADGGDVKIVVEKILNS